MAAGGSPAVEPEIVPKGSFVDNSITTTTKTTKIKLTEAEKLIGPVPVVQV